MGSCHNIFYDRDLIMKRGDICIHAPGTVHAVSAFSDDAVLVNILVRKSTFEQVFFGLMQGNSILSSFFKRSFYRTSEIPYLLFHAQNDEMLLDLIVKARAEASTCHRYKRQMVNTLISQISVRDARSLYDSGIISGGMIPKVECCIRAIDLGVKKVIIMDGTIPHALLQELLTNEGAGTMVEP